MFFYEIDNEGDDYFDAHEDDSLDTSIVEPTPYDQFLIKIEVEFLREQEHEEDDDEPDIFHLESTSRTEIFQERCDRLPCNNLPWNTAARMLDVMGVPEHKQPMMLHQIRSFVDRIANEPYNRNKKILPMRFFISVFTDYFVEESSEDSSVWIPMNTEQFNTICAGNESVEDLEKVKIEETELGSDCVCVICMEKMEVGSEATKMPCSHVYHGNCLKNWLGVKRVCPICRFVFPS
ncbi:uncharacterized protein LOC132631537 [Lycium barbarum]|uniref:uncharacterized protein LOC132631537 n=1 Tax=Lycium barbarum TaxID=112863 RepID=UPI00293E62A8|nr:uncharacterized protein LOC132631537 [Lycium barbarum]